MTQRELIENIYKDLEDVIEESNNVNDENEEIILKELALLMLYFNISNNKLQLSNIQILKIKNKIFKLIDDIFDDEIQYTIEKISNSLISITHKVESYYGGKVNGDFVNSKFKNKTFKERHSRNSTEIKNKLKSTVFKFIKGGIAIALIKSSIDKIYKIHKYNIIRLFKTEINRVQNTLFLELNKNKKFRYCSVFERNTCADCKSLDGHIFNYKEALDLIPQHSNCLCYWEVLDDKVVENTGEEKYNNSKDNNSGIEDSIKTSDKNKDVLSKPKDFGKYSTIIDDKVKVIEKAYLPNKLSKTFTDSNYRTVITEDKIIVYRTFGGRADAGGSFVTTTPAENRIQAKIDTALLPSWGNSRMYEAVIEVPKGEILNIGKVAEQTTESGSKLAGGGDQVVLPLNWDLRWIIKIRLVPSR